MNIIPPPSPNASQQQVQTLDNAVEASVIHANASFNTPQEILWVNDAAIATLGNFSASTGKAKSRKTFNVSAIVAAALRNKTVLSYRARLPEEKRRILYIDTEQSGYHCQRVLKRILALAGCHDNKDHPNLIYLGMRNAAPKERLQLVEHAITKYSVHLGMVVIDGVRDLMLDINDPSESVTVVNALMRWSATYNIHIHVVLHLNKNDDHVRGHIGTELNNKAESVLVVKKSNSDQGISEVAPLYLRDKDFKPFAFKVDDDALPVDAYDYRGIDGEKLRPKTISDLSYEENEQALNAAFKHTVIKGYTSTVKALIDAYSSIGITRKPTTMGKYLKDLILKEIVVTQDKGVYCLKKDFPSLSFNK